MKISKSYLQQIIKEELLKEFLGDPPKPPTKIKPKTKPKPEEAGITFKYMLNGKENIFKDFDYKSIFSAFGIYDSASRDDKEVLSDFMNRLALSVARCYKDTNDGLQIVSVVLTPENSYKTLRNLFLNQIPELKQLKFMSHNMERNIDYFKLQTLKDAYGTGKYNDFFPISVIINGSKYKSVNGGPPSINYAKSLDLNLKVDQKDKEQQIEKSYDPLKSLEKSLNIK